ncbi:MAG: hypothetical protein JSS32_02595 [Verrucomicrobia bacterium]|nr:hypothetical protein [Verrucomicrobiota bacterium]
MSTLIQVGVPKVINYRGSIVNSFAENAEAFKSIQTKLQSLIKKMSEVAGDVLYATPVLTTAKNLVNDASFQNDVSLVNSGSAPTEVEDLFNFQMRIMDYSVKLSAAETKLESLAEKTSCLVQ